MMRFASRYGIFAGAGALVSLVAVVLLGRKGFFAQPDASALWSWSLEAWESTAVSPAGQTIRIAHEPFALARNLAVVSLAFVGLLVGAPRVLDMFARGAAPAGDSDQIAATRKQLDGELSTILTLVRAHLETNKTYSVALAKGHKEIISSGASPDQIRTAIVLLIAENQKMLRETEEHQRRVEESQRQINELRTALAETQELNVRDSLTEVYTRRHFDATLARQVQEAGAGGALSLIMADIDHFKKINDSHGHLIGDEVLKIFARTMTKHAEEKDTVARYGGEEFAIILPDSTFAEARSTAERIRAEFETKKWAIRGGAPIGRITASFGVAQLAPRESAEGLLRRADAKLYVSKAGGRNLVSVDNDIQPR